MRPSVNSITPRQLQSPQALAALFGRIRSAMASRQLSWLQETARAWALHIQHVSRHLEAQAGGEVGVSRARQLSEELHAVAGGLLQLADELERPFLLFVIGMGKFGKSTLINALLRQPVAPTDTLPRTWKIDVFTTTLPPDTAEVRNFDGHVERMSVEAAVRLIEEEERRREASEQTVWEQFQERSRNLSSVQAKELLRHELEQLYLYVSPVVEVRWPVQRQGLATHFDVVDTPGLWQERGAISDARRVGDQPRQGAGEVPSSTGLTIPDPSTPYAHVRSEDLRSYYLQADGVLWMLDATKLASAKAHELIDSLNEARHRVGGIGQNSVAVLNRMDLVHRNGGKDAVERVVDQAHRILEGTFRHIVPLSAREAWLAVQEGNPQRYHASGLPQLLQVIEDEFRRGGAEVRWRSKMEALHQYVAHAQAVGTRYGHELTEALREVDERRQSAAQHMDSVKARLQTDYDRALREYKTSVHQHISSKLRLLLEMDEEKRKTFLTDDIFQAPRLKETFRSLVERAVREFDDTLSRLVPEQRFTPFRLLDTAVTARPVPDHAKGSVLEHAGHVSIDPFSFEELAVAAVVGIIAGIVLGPVWVLLAAFARYIPIIGDWIQEWRIGNVRRGLLRHLNDLDRQLTTEWNGLLDQIRTRAEDGLKAIREESFGSLHVPVQEVASVRETLSRLETLPDELPPTSVADVVIVPLLRARNQQRPTPIQ